VAAVDPGPTKLTEIDLGVIPDGCEAVERE
jgi:hypothetical protein